MEEPAHSPKGASSAERWNWHPKYSYLAVSSEGKLWSLLSKKFLKSRPDKDGYQIVSFGPRTAKTTARVHRLVLETFVGVSPLEADHIDRNRQHNALANLRYLTITSNRRNVGVRANSVSGIRNVRYAPEKGKWQAYCHENGRFKHLAYCKTAEVAEAIAKERYHG